MNTWDIILLSVLEILAFIVIVRLWMRSHLHVMHRLLWSLVLLVPLFGLLAYVFLISDTTAHSEDPSSPYSSGSDGGGGGHGGGDGGGH